MTGKKKTVIIIISSIIIALSAGAAISFYWVKNVYLHEKIDANADALRMRDWYRADSFQAPADRPISEEQIRAFIHVNEDLVYLLEEMRRRFEHDSWSIAFEIIKMQPEWLASKYVALKKYNLSPMEYDWIADRVVKFWIQRWKEESVEVMREYGWELDSTVDRSVENFSDYRLFVKYEKELYKIFDVLWPEREKINAAGPDSVHITGKLENE
jgi:hypothetical protein